MSNTIEVDGGEAGVWCRPARQALTKKRDEIQHERPLCYTGWLASCTVHEGKMYPKTTTHTVKDVSCLSLDRYQANALALMGFIFLWSPKGTPPPRPTTTITTTKPTVAPNPKLRGGNPPARSQ